MSSYKIGDVVRFVRGGELGVIFDSTPSQAQGVKDWYRLTGQMMHRYKVQPIDKPDGHAFWQVYDPGIILIENPTPAERAAADEALRLAKERHAAVKDLKATHRSDKVARVIHHMEANRLQVGHRVLVRGPKRQGNWEDKLIGVDYKKGRVRGAKSAGWYSAGAIIRTLEAIESELPCELSENTLDQLQDSGWAQFQTGRDFQRKTYIVAFTRDAAASKGDTSSPEVFLDPSLGLYWRPTT